MKWLHWFSIAVAVCALMVVGTGAVITNQVSNLVTTEVANPVTNEVNNQVLTQAPSRAPKQIANLAQAAAQHRMAADALALLAVIQILWMLSSAPLRGLAAINLLLVTAEIFLGRSVLAGEPSATESALAFDHAVLGQLFFALSVVVATITSPSWRTQPIAVRDKGWPSLRGYASLTALLVFFQVILGAAFRHNLLGVLWHVIGALTLILFILGLVMLIVNQPEECIPQGNPLRTPAIALLVVAGIQLFLGLTVVSMSAKAQHATAVDVLTVIHAVNGGLTFAITMVLMLLTRRHASRT